MICVQRTIQNNTNNRFFCFLPRSKSNSQIVVYMKDVGWKNLPNCFTLDYTIHRVNSEVLYVWIMSCRNRSARNIVPSPFSLSLSFLRFSPARVLCSSLNAFSSSLCHCSSFEDRNRDNCDARNHRRRRQKKKPCPVKSTFSQQAKKEKKIEAHE